jgi:hypothetical protein
MNPSFWLPLLCLILGTLLMLRAPFLITIKSNGRFRGDPWVCLVIGFGLIFLGQYLYPR